MAKKTRKTRSELAATAAQRLAAIDRMKRTGAGSHGDRRKAASKRACRGKVVV